MKITKKHHSHRKTVAVKAFRLKYLSRDIKVFLENKNIKKMNNTALKKFLNQNLAALTDHPNLYYIMPKPYYPAKQFIGLKI